MKRIVRLLCAENKRAWKIFPKMFLQAIVLALVAVTIAFCAAGFLYRGEAVEIRVAVVMEEENQMTQFALDYVKKTEENVEFVVCSSMEAFQGLEKKEYVAVIVLAKQLIEGILNGENPSVLVVCQEELSVAGSFIKELTQAGAGMLSVAQAEIYAIYELAEEYDAKSGLENFQNTINMDNLGLAMGRSGLFRYEEVSATGNLSIKTYYAASAVTAMLLFFAMPMGMFLKQDHKNVLRSYKRMGIGSTGQQTIRFLTVMGIYAVFLLAGTGIVFAWGKGSGMQIGNGSLQAAVTGFFRIWLTAGSVTAFILLIYELIEKKSSAVFLLAFLSVILLFLSGGIVPKVFFPEGVRRAFCWLPSDFWLKSIGAAIAGKEAGADGMISVGFGILFFAAAVFCRRRNLK